MIDSTMTENKLIITHVNKYIITMLADKQGKALRIYAYDTEENNLNGNIYAGRVANIAMNMNAAFVECPDHITGYLKLKNNKSPYFLNQSRKLPLRSGDRILVQVSNESIKGKNPSLSTQLSLTGKYSVLIAGEKVLNFSDKFHDPEKKKEIIKLYSEQDFGDNGFIVRTNALYADAQRTLEEMIKLHEKWMELMSGIPNTDGISAVYYAPPGFLQEIRDTYSDAYDVILTDDWDIYNVCVKYLSKYEPDTLKKVRFHDGMSYDLHVEYNIRKQIQNAMDRRIWLRSGAYIIIEPTQALVAIDVNTGKYISDKDPEKEFLKINQEAAAEIARQIRLRNLSGIIIIDFINLKDPESKKNLLEYLKIQLKSDPVKTNIIEMTKLDLVELTRTKIRRPIYEILDISMLQ